jgi:hypothetical protein
MAQAFKLGRLFRELGCNKPKPPTPEPWIRCPVQARRVPQDPYPPTNRNPYGYWWTMQAHPPGLFVNPGIVYGLGLAGGATAGAIIIFAPVPK